MGLFKSEGSLKDTEELSTANSSSSLQTLSLLFHLTVNLSIQTVHEPVNKKLHTQIRQRARGKRYLGGDQRQTHALQVAPLLTEDKVLLLGFRDDELELDLLAQHGRAEGESIEGALRQLEASTHTRALVTQRGYQATRVKDACTCACERQLCSPVQLGLPHSNADTVHSGEKRCGPRTWSDVWTWSRAWLGVLHFAESLQMAEEKQTHHQLSIILLK